MKIKEAPWPKDIVAQVHVYKRESYLSHWLKRLAHQVEKNPKRDKTHCHTSWSLAGIFMACISQGIPEMWQHSKQWPPVYGKTSVELLPKMFEQATI